MADPVAFGQCGDEVTVQAAAGTPVDLALHQHRQAVLEGQRLGGGLVAGSLSAAIMPSRRRRPRSWSGVCWWSMVDPSVLWVAGVFVAPLISGGRSSRARAPCRGWALA